MMPILIVDDSVEDADLAARVLNQCKIQNPITILKTGADCISYFESIGSHQQGTLPCLVLLDLAMGPLSGIEVLRSLRGLKQAEDSIIVMLSGVKDYNVIHQGYQLGATTFLIKPLRVEDVLQMMDAARNLSALRVSEGYVISPTPSPGGSGILREYLQHPSEDG